MNPKEDSCAAQKSLQARKYLISQSQQPLPVCPSNHKFPCTQTSQAQILQKTCLNPSLPQSGRLQSAAAQRISHNQDSPRSNIKMSSTGVQGGNPNNKMRLTQSGILYTLNLIRDPVIDYQETRGVPRTEEISFVTLVTSLCTQAYTAAITILVMLWNLMPLVDGFIYFIRFFLDKMIDIVKTENSKDKAMKGVILLGELTIIMFIIFTIIGLIFMPVYQLMARLFGKVFSMVAL